MTQDGDSSTQTQLAPSPSGSGDINSLVHLPTCLHRLSKAKASQLYISDTISSLHKSSDSVLFPQSGLVWDS